MQKTDMQLRINWFTQEKNLSRMRISLKRIGVKFVNGL